MKFQKYILLVLMSVMFVFATACSSGSGGGSSSTSTESDELDALLRAAEVPSSVIANSSAAGEIEVSWSGNQNDTRYKILIQDSIAFRSVKPYVELDLAKSPQKISGFGLGDYYVWVIPVNLDGTDGAEVLANSGATVSVTESASQVSDSASNAEESSGGTNDSTGSQNSDDESENTDETDVDQTPDETVETTPDIPGSVVASSEASGEITVSWTGDSHLGTYTLIIDDDASFGDDTPLVVRKGAVSDTSVSGLATGSYYVWVQSITEDGEELSLVSANSGASVEVSNPSSEPAETPQDVTASYPALGKITVNWTGKANGGSYKVVIDDDYNFENDTPVQIEENASSPLTVEGLASASYYVWVIPVDTDGVEGDEVAANEGGAIVVYNGTLDTADDNWTVYAGKSTIIPMANILANDANNMTDDPLEIVEVKSIVNGTIEMSESSITFSSTGVAGEAAEFTYVAQIKDNGLFFVEGKVLITVNEAPLVIAKADEKSVQQGGDIYLNVSALLANDEGTSLEFLGAFNPVNGTITVDGENITFTSTGLAYEVAQFDYKIKDALETEATGTVYIAVEPLPEVEAFIYEDVDVFNEQKVVYAPPTMDAVFNSWARFDGNNYFEGKDAPGISTNANAWEFLAEPDRVSMPLNVTPYNGFLSPQELENFTFEATVTSSSYDNDNIGLVIAFVRLDTDDDGIEDTNYTLTAVRTRGGMEPDSGWGVMYNVAEGPSHDNMGHGGKTVAEKVIGSSITANWQGVESRIKVVRSGDTITCYATDWDTTGTYEASSEIEIDLNSDPDLYKFKGAKKYGYMSFSQPDSTFLDIDFDGGLDTSTMMYVDWKTGVVQVWTYENGEWVISSSTIQEMLGYVRIVTNPVTGNKYLIKEDRVELIE